MGSKGAVSIIFRGKGSEAQELEYVDKGRSHEKLKQIILESLNVEINCLVLFSYRQIA